MCSSPCSCRSGEKRLSLVTLQVGLVKNGRVVEDANSGLGFTK